MENKCLIVKIHPFSICKQVHTKVIPPVEVLFLLAVNGIKGILSVADVKYKG